jgi:DNA-binding LacI/PurR family transcriptional regulator
MAVSQATVARRLGVSVSTVSLALQDDPRISTAVRQRVRHVAAKLDYRPSRFARAMRTGKTGLIGVIQHGTSKQFNIQRSVEVIRAIHARGYHPLMGDVMGQPGGGKAACDIMAEARVEGVLLLAPGRWSPSRELARLREFGVPLVAVSGTPMDGVPQVRADARQGMRLLAEHLVRQGRRRLMLLVTRSTPAATPEINWTVVSRIAGFQEAVAAAGGRLHRVDQAAVANGGAAPHLHDDGGDLAGTVIACAAPDVERDECMHARDAMRQMLHAGLRADAVLCTNDEWALGVLTACAEAGVRVPRDLAVTGFDGMRYAEYGPVPLTTAAQPLEAMARQAVDLLMRMMDGHQPAAGDMRVELPCRLVVRASSAGSPQRTGGVRVGSAPQALQGR